MEKAIVEKQEELERLVSTYGVGSDFVIKCSQELDELIIQYQKQGQALTK
ncbi:aspartyl-phosphate phosphatase Spo0E family protein [Evansella halocellulosilytica]|nr:aspartyl-phosphate phosphatase Spo0E family protein [Evansella halocellulosilytica]